MTLLVDYLCPACGRQERWVHSPPPAAVGCASCGAEARRAWSPVGLGGRAADIAAAPAAAQPGRPGQPGPSLCRQYPQIPGLCHMTPSAQRRMVAAYRRDGRALEAELTHQERAAAVRAPELADAVSHLHQPASASTGRPELGAD